jgi:TIR domain
MMEQRRVRAHMQQLSSPASVFCLAAPSDAALLAEWETHLLPLQQAGLITIWSERLVQLGAVPRMQQIHDHLDHADLIVLLLSSDFFAHDECFVLMERAIKRAERNKVRLIPLLLRPVAWRESPLAPYPCLPTNKHPVTEWPSRDAAFNDCVRDIRHLLGRPVTVLLPRRARPTGAPQTGKGHRPPWAKKTTIVGVLFLILVSCGTALGKMAIRQSAWKHVTTNTIQRKEARSS